MLSHNKIKFIRSLDIKKNRLFNHSFVVEGEKMVLELLKSKVEIIEIFAVQSFIKKYSNQFHPNYQITEISNDELKKISSLATPNQVLAVAKIPDNNYDKTVFNDLVIVLDNVQDPGNLGTIIRTANWFGVSTLFCSSDTVDAYNPKVVQSTMGAIFRTQIIYGDLVKIITDAKNNGTAIYGALLNGNDLFKTNLKRNGLIVLGNESKGISKPIQELIDNKILIPSYPEESKDTESLNVAIANAIILAEFRRKLNE